MRMLQERTATPDPDFKVGISAELREAFSARIVDELCAASRPDKTYLIPEVVALTLHLNALKNKMRAGCDEYDDRQNYFRVSTYLFRSLQQMGVPVTGRNTGIFAADLCFASKDWIASCLDHSDIGMFSRC